MHLWPTMRIRESFKISYLKKYDWNLQRMNSEKKRQSQEANDNSNQQRLLDDAGENSRNQQKPANNSKAVLICREILMNSLLLGDSLELKFEDLSVPLIYSMRY
ncbi:hypothetical protein NC653_020205 [Populus alba x Populus x berolinensis]|uniref:Uncharacterized protein n=1 Tax=Populus alba x Populus x berolinensis TaxID=444605 RepID=A0AAD6MMA2_9ROSI|nr:hypothetical protein NC653_020205 [Populus alba x Populus x berolinensis]